jgi:very-short-patch-repair endonuclease
VSSGSRSRLTAGASMGTRKAFEDDRRRDAELVARGFRVIRVTWGELEDNAFAVVARIAAALADGRR